jgi:hypothetical protein
MILAALGAGLWLLVRSYGRERAKAAEKQERLARAYINRDKEERKDALDTPMPTGPGDEFWVLDEGVPSAGDVPDRVERPEGKG